MLRLKELLEISENDKLVVCKELNINLEECEQLRKLTKEYIDKSEHLPKDYDTAMINGSIVNNKANFQAGKTFIENYFRSKNKYAEVIYDHCLPSSIKYQESRKHTINICSRKLTPEGYRVQYFKLVDPEAAAENAFSYIIMMVMLCELRGTYDFWTSTVFILDMEGMSYKHLLKFSPHWAFVCKDLLENIHFRVQSIHVVNGPAIIEMFLEIAKTALPKKLQERLSIHKNYESLQQAIPKECLPIDYGGSDKSVQELREEWSKAVEELEPFFQKLRAAKSTKKYELNESEIYNLGLGVEGTFKKLNID